MESTLKPAATAAATKEVQTIQMDDGRSVEFPGKRRLQKDVTIGSDGSVKVRLDFVNGETRTCTLSPSLLAKAAGHGLSQKLGDEISGVKDLEDAIVATDELMERLKKGEWNETAQTGEGLAGASILMKALMEVSGKGRDEVKVWLSALNPKQKTAMREQAAVKPVVARLEAEKAAKAKPKAAVEAVDTGALMAGLMAGKSPVPNSAFAAGDAAAPPKAPAPVAIATATAKPAAIPAAVKK